MKLSHTKLIVISGLVWLAIGVYLLQLGVGLLIGGVQAEMQNPTGSIPLVAATAAYVGSIETAAMILMAIALYTGYFKGKFALGKSAKRGVERILSLPNPAPLAKIYNPKYYILLGVMVALGISIKYIGLSNDVRGFIDVIIGSALVNGAVIYFRLAQQAKEKSKAHS